MSVHFDLTDNELESQLANCLLDPIIFNHETHLRLAWIHIKKCGLEQAELNIHQQLQKFVEHLGATDKYHKTITIAAIRVVNHFMAKSKAFDFKTFIKEFPQLNTDFKSLIESHYSFDIFSSKQARLEFLEPDLVDFN